MPTFYASIIQMYALWGGELERDPGQWANAAFYGLLSQVDPHLAEALHQWKGRKPFTISSLHGLGRSAGPNQAVSAGQACWLRVTMLNDLVFQTFIQRFLQGGLGAPPGPQIQLGPLGFAVSAVLTTPGSHPWAGTVPAETLRAQAAPAERLALEFASPTAFHVSGRYELFPMPRLVFGALAARWRDCVAPAMDPAYIEDLAGDLLISEFSLRTENLRWDGRVQKGFTGRCAYHLDALPPSERALLAALADFAYYSGVGGKTTQGMGQCRRVHP